PPLPRSRGPDRSAGSARPEWVRRLCKRDEGIQERPVERCLASTQSYRVLQFSACAAQAQKITALMAPGCDNRRFAAAAPRERSGGGGGGKRTARAEALADPRRQQQAARTRQRPEPGMGLEELNSGSS